MRVEGYEPLARRGSRMEYGLPAPPRERGSGFFDGCLLMEPHKLEAIASTEADWGSSPEPMEDSIRDRLEAVLARLLPRDRQILEWNAEGMLQAEMGRRLGISQGSVSLRIKHALLRAQVIAKTPAWAPDEIRERLRECGVTEAEIVCTLVWWGRPNVADVAVITKLPWSTARDRVARAVTKTEGTEVGDALRLLRDSHYTSIPRPTPPPPKKGKQVGRPRRKK